MSKEPNKQPTTKRPPPPPSPPKPNNAFGPFQIITKDQLKDAAILAIKQNPSVYGSEDIMMNQDKYLMSVLPPGCLVWFFEPSESIETMSEAEMNAAGWYRK